MPIQLTIWMSIGMTILCQNQFIHHKWKYQCTAIRISIPMTIYDCKCQSLKDIRMLPMTIYECQYQSPWMSTLMSQRI